MTTHIRNSVGRALCGSRLFGRAGWRFVELPQEATCRRCWARYKPPKAQALSDAELLELDRGWREGWAQEFPGEPYPGLVEARRRIREKLPQLWGTTHSAALARRS